MITLKENDKIGLYKVQRLIKEGLYNSTYRVLDEDGKSFFMKFYDPDIVPVKYLKNGEIREILYSRRINHGNVISYVNDGVVLIGGRNYKYLITNYFVGSLLSEFLEAGQLFPLETAKGVIVSVLKGLEYLHSELGLNHNDLTPRNIILEKTNTTAYIPKIIDLGHLCPDVGGNPPFPVIDLTPEFCAPESFAGFYSGACDAFSAMAIFYNMLCGKVPWPSEIINDEPFSEKKKKIRRARRKELDIATLKEKGVPDEVVQVIENGLSLNSDSRASVRKLIAGLCGEERYCPNNTRHYHAQDRLDSGAKESLEKEAMITNVEIKKAKGGGFSDVAGMESLKAELTNRVIWILRDKETAAMYKLSPPNGMILYGPPGCGKTFFAEKFAEESQFNFTLVNGSDLGSIYVHGTQGKIAELFAEAEKKAPTILCFDEFDSFVPSRSSAAAQHRPEEVNEFLGQLNNCSKRGIFVIGTTNRLDMIDPAVLRKGRMDLHVEIPAPDARTRALIFKIHLKDRPLSKDINYEELAEKTANYAASDISFIVNDAAMNAALARREITHDLLLNSINCTRSSLGPLSERRKIGF